MSQKIVNSSGVEVQVPKIKKIIKENFEIPSFDASNLEEWKRPKIPYSKATLFTVFFESLNEPRRYLITSYHISRDFGESFWPKGVPAFAETPSNELEEVFYPDEPNSWVLYEFVKEEDKWNREKTGKKIPIDEYDWAFLEWWDNACVSRESKNVKVGEVIEL